eukprot:CAMPEP_0168405918 /NCGR_PEP_ID=MMETSP0228-20121227/25385_1 /TAXON_ID=133427 /ORGANISM="Protoceratium reticulatum, Strain CCCM 535 (=CCMP 1889)" /LENGTH=165 /DNA_ID=CAMNT_0008419553 /DNA_START=141 /DNA_END=635 /DNA_ORIENTATION=-
MKLGEHLEHTHLPQSRQWCRGFRYLLPILLLQMLQFGASASQTPDFRSASTSTAMVRLSLVDTDADRLLRQPPDLPSAASQRAAASLTPRGSSSGPGPCARPPSRSMIALAATASASSSSRARRSRAASASAHASCICSSATRSSTGRSAPSQNAAASTRLPARS